MIRFLVCCFLVSSCVSAAMFGQASGQKDNPVKKFELRPSSKEYAPIRRGDSYQPVIRSKAPTMRSQQIRVGNKKIGRPENKHIRRNKAATFRKNRRIKR